MLVHTDYLWFNTKKRQEFIRMTDEVAAIVQKSGVREGMVLVSANSRLRAELQEHGRLREMPTFLPSLSLSTDNAAMIAAAGLRRFRAGVTASMDLNADPALVL